MASSVSSTGNGYNFKVVLLGEGCVGKTSVALRYVEGKFNDKHISTLQVRYVYTFPSYAFIFVLYIRNLAYFYYGYNFHQIILKVLFLRLHF